MLGRAPKNWWRKRAPRKRAACFRTKTDALNAFRAANEHQIQAAGGMDQQESPSEFDAVNHKYGTRARTLAEALWAALPTKRPPYCVEDIDLEALNDTDAGRTSTGFRFPDWVYEQRMAAEQEAYYREQYGLGGTMRKRGTHRATASVRGWDRAKPKRMSARRRVLDRCGRDAFLLVKRTKTGLTDPKFPIVATGGGCAPDCRGLWAAKQRASQTGRKKLVAKATRIASAAGCVWAMTPPR